MLPLFWALAMLMSGPQPDPGIRLSLHQEFGRALYRTCRLELVIYEGAAGASLLCVRNGLPARDVVNRRALTNAEVSRLIRLVRESNLFTGGYVGEDHTASDGVFETLRVSRGAETGVLVTTGNTTFGSGTRQTLLVALQTLMRELQNSAR